MDRFHDIDLNRTEYDKLDILETFDGDIRALRSNLAKRFHPDTGNEPNAVRMQEINGACDLLGDPTKRKAYDDALRRAREKARTEPAEERKAARPRTRTSPPPPPQPPPPPPPRPKRSLRSRIRINLWWVPTLIPFVGPFVSWTYAAVKTHDARYRRWAWVYSILVVYLILALTAVALFGGDWVTLTGTTKEVEDVFGYVIWLGPALHAFARRKEVGHALASGRRPT